MIRALRNNAINRFGSIKTTRGEKWGVKWFQRGAQGQSTHCEAVTNWDSCAALVGTHHHVTSRQIKQLSGIVMPPRVPPVRVVASGAVCVDVVAPRCTGFKTPKSLKI